MATIADVAAQAAIWGTNAARSNKNKGTVRSSTEQAANSALGELFGGAEDLNTYDNRVIVHTAFCEAYDK